MYAGIVETHCHYDDEAFDNDRDDIIKELKNSKIEYAVNVSSSLGSIKSTIALSEKYDFIYAASGVHPDDIEDLNEETFIELENSLSNNKVVAVGEIGLDYYWQKDPDIRKQQRIWFLRQLEMAKSHNLPVIIHSREAAADTIEVLKKADLMPNQAVMHCFSYSQEIANIVLDMGFYLGIGGVVTFKNAKKLKEIVTNTPLDRILLETDCPYLAPEPKRGKRNDSRNLIYVAQQIADLKGLDVQKVIQTTAKNAKSFYNLSSGEL